MTITILWRDGFDHYLGNADLATLYSSMPNGTTFGAGRTDGKSVILSSGFGESLNFQGVSAQSDITMALATYNKAGNNVNAQNYNIYDAVSGVNLATLNLNTPNQAIVTTGGVSYTGAIPLIPMLNWTHIQFRLIIGAAGSFELRLNGSPSASFTKVGIETRANSGAVTTANGVAFPIGGGGNAGLNQIDDFMIYTGGFLGDCRIQTDFPISDHSVAFTRLSGSSNFAMVSENAMDSDTTYNYTTTVGATDLFGFTTLVLPTGGTIIDVSLVSAARKDDAGARTFQHKISSGTGNSVGAATAVSTSYEYFVDTFTVDPGTSAAWTLAGLNAAFYGYLEQS